MEVNASLKLCLLGHKYTGTRVVTMTIMTIFIQVIDPSLMEVSVTSSVDDDAMSATESDMMKASMTTSISDG